MSEPLFTVEQVAESLNLHVRTIRNYVAAGKLKAMRIGKQYRVARSDLEAFTGGTSPTIGRRTGGVYGRADATCVIQVDAISRDGADRLTGLLTAAANAPRSSDGLLSVSTAYEPVRSSLRVIIVSGDLRAAGELIAMIEALTKH